MHDNGTLEIFVVLFGVLRIQNAVLFLAQADASEQIGAVETPVNIGCITSSIQVSVKFTVIAANTARYAFVEKFATGAKR